MPFAPMYQTAGVDMYVGAVERAAKAVRGAKSQQEAEAQTTAMRMMVDVLEAHLKSKPLGQP